MSARWRCRRRPARGPARPGSKVREALQNRFSPPSTRSCQRMGEASTISSPAAAIERPKSGHRSESSASAGGLDALSRLDRLHARSVVDLDLVQLELGGLVARRREQLEPAVHADQRRRPCRLPSNPRQSTSSTCTGLAPSTPWIMAASAAANAAPLVVGLMASVSLHVEVREVDAPARRRAQPRR